MAGCLNINNQKISISNRFGSDRSCPSRQTLNIILSQEEIMTTPREICKAPIARGKFRPTVDRGIIQIKCLPKIEIVYPPKPPMCPNIDPPPFDLISEWDKVIQPREIFKDLGVKNIVELLEIQGSPKFDKYLAKLPAPNRKILKSFLKQVSAEV
jgi:hypothetical protein